MTAHGGLRWLGRVPYRDAQQAMEEAVNARIAQRDTPDECWLLEHDPVYTLGVRKNREHVLMPGDIPVVESGRGGDVTYHGPGQLVVYPMIDLQRAQLTIKQLVSDLEQVAIDVLQDCGIRASRTQGAPGAYVNGAKIASVGLRVRRSISFHGLSLNVDMDMAPWLGVHPCGYAGLSMTQVVDHVPVTMDHVKALVQGRLRQWMGAQARLAA